MPELRVCALYPDLMNIYADRGNLLMLQRRCEWRDIQFALSGAGIGDSVDPNAHDLFYVGGGQDRDQLLCSQDLLATKREPLQRAAERGAVVLGVCGGYQMLGGSYVVGDERLEGVGLLDAVTERIPGAPRLIGNIAIELAGPRARDASATTLAGFENHGGRTRLAPGQQPLGRVLKGHGNDGTSGHEGARTGNVIGTYMHGPLLPKNAWFADHLIELSLALQPGALAPLDDTLEDAAAAAARRAAGV